MLTLLAMLLGSSPASIGAPDECQYDLSSYVGMNPIEFDQGENGWRHLASTAGCEREAAELIQKYVHYNENQLDEDIRPLLLWHRGQILAFSGNYGQAIPEMTASRKRTTADIDGWNLYVEGTIAFLENDRAAFNEVIFALKALKRPPGYPEGDLEWPPNLSVLTRMGKCFGSPYKQAYEGRC